MMNTPSSFRRASAAAEYVQVQIPFPGIYDSALSDEVEHAVDCECEHLQDEGADFDGRPVTEEALEAARDAVTVDGFMELEIAEKWTQVMEIIALELTALKLIPSAAARNGAGERGSRAGEVGQRTRGPEKALGRGA